MPTSYDICCRLSTPEHASLGPDAPRPPHRKHTGGVQKGLVIDKRFASHKTFVALHAITKGFHRGYQARYRFLAIHTGAAGGRQITRAFKLRDEMMLEVGKELIVLAIDALGQQLVPRDTTHWLHLLPHGELLPKKTTSPAMFRRPCCRGYLPSLSGN
jgi:hypothetical protein